MAGGRVPEALPGGEALRPLDTQHTGVGVIRGHGGLAAKAAGASGTDTRGDTPWGETEALKLGFIT